MFPVDSLPQLSKGKGNKIINIPSAEAAKAMMDWRTCTCCRHKAL